ncbi:uroporphyrinogen-III C-methyltransferase [Malikia spinosa]|uniref:uroporphyrinogen-III C-methyltransferase n=1 Tax=Malikia spinosa TaxID=86180 RepID=UPI0027B965BB|nr:uroporphyrinogen-III C-methyltransferase [Malikia spinosa]
MMPVLSEQARGTVSLVGAGPGDLELLTLRAWRRLQMAEVLVYDNLVGPGIVDLAPPQAQRLYVGKSAGNHTLPQDEICQLLVRLAQQGRRVVRLKGGDPFVFGRGGEEMDRLLQHQIPVEIVPGITAALGAAASFGFPLTHRDHAQSCVFVTGHQKDHKVELNWPALAQPGQTVVIYMGVTGLETIASGLQSAGLPGNTPAALVYKATWPQEAIFPTRLCDLASTAERYGVKPPSLLVIGSVVSLAQAWSIRSHPS